MRNDRILRDDRRDHRRDHRIGRPRRAGRRRAALALAASLTASWLAAAPVAAQEAAQEADQAADQATGLPAAANAADLAPATIPAVDGGCLTDLCAEGLSGVGKKVGFGADGGVRIAVLLPLSAPGRIGLVAAGLRQAALMAQQDLAVEGLTVEFYDTAGPSDAPAEAARQATEDGAALLIGPLLPAAAAEIAPMAVTAKLPMLSLGRAPSGPGVFQIGDEPTIAVSRVVSRLAKLGVRRFGFMGPEGAYGDQELAALQEAVAAVGGEVAETQRYKLDYSAIETSAREYADRLKNLPADRRVAAVMLPGGGEALQTVAAYLGYFGIKAPEVRFFGNAAWRGGTGREDALNGGLYAAPDPAVMLQFERRLKIEMAQDDQATGQLSGAPVSLLALAYDAVALAAVMVENARTEEREFPFTAPAFLAREGYFGVHGAYRFTPHGAVERLLPVISVDVIGDRVIDPAPEGFQ